MLDRALDIVAGPADPTNHSETLRSPSAVATDSKHRVFVADPGVEGVHIFDFVRSRYARLDARGGQMHVPIALAVDGQDNVYVIDQTSRTVLVYDATGRFRRYLGKLRGGESYFENPTGIGIDKTTERIYVCDRQADMIFVMDQRGKVIRRVGKRGGGDGPGEFHLPSRIVVANGVLIVFDSGNARLELLDTDGRFLRAVNLGYADRHAGLAVDSEGNIYVSDPDLDQIQVFRRDGQMLSTLDPSTVKGVTFSHPSGMWIDGDHSLFVVDSQSSRIVQLQIKAEKAAQ